jgi:hypothetical protein
MKEMEDLEKAWKANHWAIVTYHKSYKMDMNEYHSWLARSIIAAFLVCWI